MQQRAHRLRHAHLRQLQHAFYAGNRLQTTMIAAVTAFAVGIDLGMANLHQAAAAGVQQAPIGDHPGADVMIDDHLNDVLAPREAPNKDSAIVQALMSC